MVTIVRSCIHIFKDDGGAQSIATIPLDSYTDAGAATVILIFAYWGLSQLMFGLLQAIVALKYNCLLYTSPSPRDATLSRMPSSA